MNIATKKPSLAKAAVLILAGVALVGTATTHTGLFGWCAGWFLMGWGAAALGGRGQIRKEGR